MKTLSREGIQRMVGGAGGGSVSGGGISGSDLAGLATQVWVNQNYLSIEFFSSLFKAYAPAETTGDPDVEVTPNGGDTSTITNIKAMFGFWTEQYISALGQGQGGGGGGATALTDLTDVEFSGTPSDGQVLKYNATTHKWYNGTDEGVTSLAWSQITGKPTTLAGYGITDAYTKTEADERYLKLSGGSMLNTNVVTNMNADLLDGLNGADYLSRHNTINDFDTAQGQKIIAVSGDTTLIGVNTWGSLIQWGNSNRTPGTADNNTWYNQLIGLTNDRLYFRTRTNGEDWTTAKEIAFISDFSSWALASTKPSYAFSELTSHPTTLSGYGITDAKIENGTITLGSATITPLTSFTETDPTVPAWAKASTKPSYSFSELTSHPTTLSGYGITDAYISGGTIYLGSNSITPLTSFTETDPTVPAWAKASTKPSYSFSELTGSVAFSQLPTMYWANVAVSSQSSVDTEPQFKNLRLKSSTSNMGSYLRFGDGDYAYIAEIPEDDSLTYHVATSDKHIFNVGSYDRLHVTSAGISVLGSIDFFYNGASSYTSRITEDASGRIYLNAGNGVRIGNGVLIWDSTNNALKIQKNDGTAANLYATGGVCALGMSAGTSSVSSMTFNYLKVNNELTLPPDIIADTGAFIVRNRNDGAGLLLFNSYENSKITSHSYYYNQYDNLGLHGTDYNYDKTWWIDPDGCAKFNRLYLDGSRYLYVSNGTLYYFNGSSSRAL